MQKGLAALEALESKGHGRRKSPVFSSPVEWQDDIDWDALAKEYAVILCEMMVEEGILTKEDVSLVKGKL